MDINPLSQQLLQTSQQHSHISTKSMGGLCARYSSDINSILQFQSQVFLQYAL